LIIELLVAEELCFESMKQGENLRPTGDEKQAGKLLTPESGRGKLGAP